MLNSTMTHIHFIAIGGAAMHNLALAVASKAGYKVTGSDDEIFDPALSHLRDAGLLPDEMGWHPERITPDIDAIILGMHAREDNPELVRARELGIKIYSFPEYLYEGQDPYCGRRFARKDNDYVDDPVCTEPSGHRSRLYGRCPDRGFRKDGTPERHGEICRF